MGCGVVLMMIEFILGFLVGFFVMWIFSVISFYLDDRRRKGV